MGSIQIIRIYIFARFKGTVAKRLRSLTMGSIHVSVFSARFTKISLCFHHFSGSIVSRFRQLGVTSINTIFHKRDAFDL